MISGSIRKPITSAFAESGDFAGIPEITDVHFDLRVLRITLRFGLINHPVCVSFDGVRGFRLLDEGDLLEFWGEEARSDGWLWEVEEGGWFSLEKLREGFVSGITGGYREYLVAGENDCISVIATNEPKIEMSTP